MLQDLQGYCYEARIHSTRDSRITSIELGSLVFSLLRELIDLLSFQKLFFPCLLNEPISETTL